MKNLYKLNDDQTPRISTHVGKTLVGIDPQMLEDFINDVLFCFDEDLARHISKWRTGSAVNFAAVILNNNYFMLNTLLKYQKRSLQDISYYF